MRYPNWKQLIIFCVSLLACFFAETVYVFSCGPTPDPLDYYASFYNPNIAVGKGFEALYYTGLQPLYGEDEPEETVLIGEWSKFFTEKGGKVSDHDIAEFMYTYPRPVMAAIYNTIDKGGSLAVPDSVTNNSLTKYFISSKDKETLGYFMFAKQCETYVNNGDMWERNGPDSATMMRLSRNGIQLYAACKDQRIKERFAFQSTRLAHYCKNAKTAIHYYDSLLTPIPSSSLIHYKALALKAGALRLAGRNTESAYYFSRVFESVPCLRTMAYRNTLWTGATKRAVLGRCANNSEKASVAALYAFREVDVNPGGLREVYSYEPQSPMLDVLLAREVNKLEEGYLQSSLNLESNNYWSAGPNPSISNVKTLQHLADSIAAAGKVKEPALWQITSAYLAFMQKDYAGANTRLAAASPQRTDVKDQQEIVRLLVNINEQKTIDKNFEAKLLSSLKWLDTRLPKDRREYNFYYNETGNKWISDLFYIRMYRNVLDYVILPRYEKQNDLLRSALIMTKRDHVSGFEPSPYWSPVSGKAFIQDSLNSDQLIALRDLWKSKNKSAYEKPLRAPAFR